MTSSMTASYKLESKESSIVSVLIFSAVFHILVFFVGPVIARLVWHPKKFVRPHTFQLVRIPQKSVPIQEKVNERQKLKKKTVSKKPVPRTKKDSKPVQKKEELEDLSELEELLGGLPQPVSQISIGKVFPYQWYLDNIRMQVERNWKPSINDKSLEVILQFSIFANGKISTVKISKSSGNSSLDNLAVRAVKLAAPFGKIPAGWGDNRLDLSYTLVPALN